MKIETPFKHKPDFAHMEDVLMRRTKAGPVPIFEGVVDAEIATELTGMDFPLNRVAEIVNIGPVPTIEQMQLGLKLMDISISFYKGMGYDYAIMIPVVPLARTPMHLKANPQQKELVRAWQNEHSGLISSREDFKAFPWPSLDSVNIITIDYAAAKLIPGMKVMVFIYGIFEDLRSLLGFEQLAIKSIEEPELLGDILEILVALEERAIEKAAAHPSTGAIFYAEDLAFNNGTMLSPRWIREWLIPRHKRLAAAAHKHGKPFLFHSCGQINAIMEDLIEVVRIDGRHSYQDNIEPVEEVYRKYGDRISIIGGVDVNILAMGTPDQVRARVRQILEACAPGGGFIMGSGNSVTNYCKIENYLAMLEETNKWNEEHA